jgi:type IV pilus assembly protein PilM
VKTQVENLTRSSSSLISRDEELQTQFGQLKELGDEVVGGADARFLVLELVKAVNSALPAASVDDPAEVSKVPYPKRTELYLESVQSEFFPNLSDYFTTDAQERYLQFLRDLALMNRTQGATPAVAAAGDADATEDAEAGDEEAGSDAAEEGATSGGIEPVVPDVDFARPGWVIEIKGFHFRDEGTLNSEANYLMNTFMKALETGTVELPSGPNEPPTTFTMKELGIYCPLIAQDRREVTIRVPDPNYDPSKAPPPTATSTRAGGERGWAGGDRNRSSVPMINATAYEFTVQFMWLETRASERMEARKKAEAAEQQPTTPTDDVAGGF